MISDTDTPYNKDHAEADKRNGFDISSLVNRSMEVKPDEQYTVYKADAPGKDAAIDENEDEDILNYGDVDDPETFA